MAKKPLRAVASGFSSIHPLRVACLFELTPHDREALWRRIEELWGEPVPFVDRAPVAFECGPRP
jgi:hypothetical protein